MAEFRNTAPLNKESTEGGHLGRTRIFTLEHWNLLGLSSTLCQSNSTVN